MNKLIEKEPSLEFVIPVLKWLKDPKSVSLEERKANFKAASAAAASASAASAASGAADANAAEYCVKIYFERVLITRKEVELELFKSEEMKCDNDVVQPVNTYMHKIKGVELDCYDVLLGFNVTCPATQHAIKKQLCGGSRGYKDRRKDLSEAIDSLKRAIQLIDGSNQ